MTVLIDTWSGKRSKNPGLMSDEIAGVTVCRDKNSMLKVFFFAVPWSSLTTQLSFI